MKTLTDEFGQKHLFSVPITCPLIREEMESFKNETQVGLKCSEVSDKVLAVIEKPNFFENRKEEICARTFGTFSLKHPKVERIMC